MPLFYQHNINESTRLAVWKIEEEENFFSFNVPFHREIKHPHKRLQHLAGRFLLQHLVPGFPYELMVIADTRKPFLSNEAYHFSISHCNDYAAAIVSSNQRVGVDIELVKPQISAIRTKFLSEEEWSKIKEGFPGKDEGLMLTMAWSSKEAMYKWYGYGGVDFKKQMILQEILSYSGGWQKAEFLFAKENEVLLELKARIFGNLVLAFVAT